MFTTTNSEMGTLKRCERLHFYRYVLLRGYLGESAKPLEDGNQGHEWLEDWWQYKDELRQPKDPKIRAMCHGYDARYSEVNVDGTATGELEYEIIGVEMVLSFTISDNIRVALKLDGLIKDKEGKLWVLEHKTSGVDTSPGADYWTALRLDSQISTYILACKCNGYDVEGVLYDVLNKPAIKPLLATPEDQRKYTKPTKKDPVPRLYANQRDTDETENEFYLRCLEAISAEPDRYYRREFVRRTDADLEEAAYEIQVWAHRAHENNEAGKREPRSLPVRNSTGCMRYNRLCEFFGACSGAQQIETHPKLLKRHTELPEEYQ